LNTQFSQVHWGRVLLIGVLLAILILILNLVLSFLLLAFLNWGHLDPHSAIQVFPLILAFLAILLTGYGALRVASNVESAAPLHGFLVGLVAALIYFLIGLASSRGLDLVALVPFVLMVAAGWLGGVLGSRVRSRL
jgi:putative membrane protein (TIGR04086 family)